MLHTGNERLQNSSFIILVPIFVWPSSKAIYHHNVCLESCSSREREWPSPADLCCLLQLLDELEGRQAGGGKVVDYHSCELFPERWFDAVFVLRTGTKYLFDRLKERYVFSILTCIVLKSCLRIIPEQFLNGV